MANTVPAHKPKKVVDFSGLRIRIANPETIKSWSFGEVTKPETINYRTQKAEKDGLFDEKIFGPTKDYVCYCGKYKGIRYKGIVCDKCGVEVTQSRVRRQRMGHINLAAPVAHIWFFKGAPSKLSNLLGVSPRNLASIIYFSQFIVLDVDKDAKIRVLEELDHEMLDSQERARDEIAKRVQAVKDKLDEDKAALRESIDNEETLEIKLEALDTKARKQIAKLKEKLQKHRKKVEEVYGKLQSMVKKIRKKTIISEDEYLKLEQYGAADHIRVGMGAESIMELVNELDLDVMVKDLREQMEDASKNKHKKLTKRLRVVEGFREASIDPSWMFLSILPVLPPDLRPMVQLSGGRFAASDLNDLYRRVINRNNRLKHLIDLGAPDIILRNEKRMLQESVDALIDSSKARSRRRNSNRELRSLSDMLKGKQGRFRQNLLGKRVDYSGRSVIVVGPELKLNQCGLPKDMALEMFRPHVLNALITSGAAPNVKSAKNAIERRDPEVYDALEEVTREHPVMLNRAPTLHKLGIQAFYPVLVEGHAIRLHPCVCSGYNADFDGDQMAVHVPLTDRAIQDAKELMMPSRNLLKPANGDPITVPNKEMAMGIYYYTVMDNRMETPDTIFGSKNEAVHAYQAGRVELRQPIKVRNSQDFEKPQIITTTVGRIELNNLLPEDMRYINEAISSKRIKEIVTDAIRRHDRERVAELLDDIKALGFESTTISGLSVSVTDCEMILEKDEIIDKASEKAEVIVENFQDGLITDSERRQLLIDTWLETTETVANKTWDSYDEFNAVKVIINSGGTRASKDQVKQLAAMRGLVVDPMGKIVEMPTKSNFRQGLTIFEYVISARGSRKGLTDSALKTADAGYLTRRLVDVSHDVIIRLEDCGTEEYIEINRGHRADVFVDRIIGRFAAKDIEIDGEILVAKDDIIEPEHARKIDASGADGIAIRSPLTCEAPKGLCKQCYGWDFSTREEVEIGVPVGVVAAQSIGEPGTQLTMRTKHSGGVVGQDVTQGLPRVEQLFEARTPKNKAKVSDVTGTVSIEEDDDAFEVTIKTTDGEEKGYTFAKPTSLVIEDGDLISKGDPLTGGSVDPTELVELKGMLGAQQHVVDEVQAVYESQGIPINDKHFEIIIRKMADKLQITHPGDTEFLTGETIERNRFNEANKVAMAEGGEPASAKVMLLGITRSSLFTSSWLSAASFQHTKSILTNAAASGAVDHLEGLKENVIIGRLIPTSEDRARIDVDAEYEAVRS